MRPSAENAPAAGARLPRPRTLVLLAAILLVVAGSGCAKYNTYYNAKKAFDSAERVREDAVRRNQDPPKPVGAQKSDYETAIAKAQKVLDDYPGHSLSDDALFLRAKAYYRLESYRMSIRQFDLLFQNFPASEYLEESLYLQALNYLLIDAVDRSQDYLGQLERAFPDSRYQAEVSRVSGDNSYTLEDWEGARTAYRQYLALGDEARDRDRVSLKLAECLWELERFADADTVLGTMLAEVAPGELKFRAELLRGRVLGRTGRSGEAEQVLNGLDQAASFHKADGELALAKGELLVASGRSDDAAALLQGMPAEWLTPVVKARVADLLGYRFLEREEYAEAHEQFRTALGQRLELDDPDRTRLLSDQLQDYLAADKDLGAAPPERVPRLKLLQANAMLFGFERPAKAAALYREAAADTAADSLLAARALYGLWLTWARELDQPDSAAAVATELRTRFPDSAQARELAGDDTGTLLEFLLAEREQVQRRNLANLTDEEREALERVAIASGDSGPASISARAPVRRRQIYLARREPLRFPPPDRVIPIGGPVRPPEGAPRPGEEPPTGVGPGDPGALPVPGAAGAVDDIIAPDDQREGAAAGGSTVDPSATEAGAVEDGTPETTPDAGEEPKKPEETKPVKERDPNWDRLRSPAPGPRP